MYSRKNNTYAKSKFLLTTVTLSFDLSTLNQEVSFIIHPQTLEKILGSKVIFESRNHFLSITVTLIFFVSPKSSCFSLTLSLTYPQSLIQVSNVIVQKPIFLLSVTVNLTSYILTLKSISFFLTPSTSHPQIFVIVDVREPD